MTASLTARSALVVGGCGFIGSNLVHALLRRGIDTAVVDCLAHWGGGNLGNLHKVRDAVEVYRFNVRRAADFDDVFRRRDVIFVLIGSAGHVESMRDPTADLKRNCASHLGLLEVVRRVNPTAKLVVTSTRQIYGRPQRLPIDETHPIRPVDVNGIHFQAVESYYRLYQEIYGLRSACLRLTNTYGPRMSLRRSCYGFAPVVIRQALRGEPIRLFDDGMQQRNLQFVDDVVKALIGAAALEMDRHEAYNIGSAEPVTLRYFCEVLTAHLRVPIRYEPFPAERRSIDIGDSAVSSEKFLSASDIGADTSLEVGLRRTIDYYLARPREFALEVEPSKRASIPLFSSHSPSDSPTPAALRELRGL